MVTLTIALATLVGVTLGLLGGGGSILLVPLLVWVGGVDPRSAIAMSLLVVGVTSAAALVPHARAGRVHWRTGLVFGVAGMVGAYGGGRLGSALPANWLLMAFGLMMAVTSVAMLRGRSKVAPSSGQPRIGRLLVDGVVVGAVTGLVGAGGGFLIVPALTLLAGLAMPAAVGTSLLVLAMKSGAGFLGYLDAVDLDLPLTAAVAVAAVVGSAVGARFVDRIDPVALRRIFGWVVAAMGTVVLAQSLT